MQVVELENNFDVFKFEIYGKSDWTCKQDDIWKKTHREKKGVKSFNDYFS